MVTTGSFKSKFRPVFWGFVLVIAAVMLILGATDAIPIKDTSWFAWWRIMLGAIFGGWFIYELVLLKIPNIFFPLAFTFMVFEAPLANALGKGNDLISNWIILLVAFLLTIGFSLLIPKQNFVKNANFTRSTFYYDAGKDLKEAFIHDNVGNAEVYITNRGSYDGMGVIKVFDNLGKVTIHVPGTWRVDTQAADNIGRVEIPKQDFNCSKSITLVIKDNMGVIRVIFD